MADPHPAPSREALEAAVVRRLGEAGAFLSVVESCTGGLISSRITDVSGASRVFWGAWVPYDYSALEALGVSSGLLETHGAVSEQATRALAEAGLAAMLDKPGLASICLANSGIAGPTGGTAAKPVGLGFVAVATAGGTVAKEVRAPGGASRTAAKAFFADEALAFLIEVLDRL